MTSFARARRPRGVTSFVLSTAFGEDVAAGVVFSGVSSFGVDFSTSFVVEDETTGSVEG